MGMKSLLSILACAACATPATSEPGKSQAASPATQAPPTANQDVGEPYAQHIAALRKRLVSQRMGDAHIRVEAPFVVVGDGTAEQLSEDAQTVRWAVQHLERDFFAARPTKILDVYLFGDARSYQRGVKVLTGDDPSTPYGFYSRAQGGLFMNIATGGGTLVHEIVHPYVEADFPNAPPWLNEGLGSLFEQSASRDGHIIGLTNWRLEGLQRAIAENRVPTFKALTHLGDDEFYGDDSGVNYAASRYLLYYLQEQGKLRAFYTAFRAARTRDPSGYATLVATLGEQDMTAFEARWRAYVGKLRFP
jgi:hypothetical protein